MADGTRQVRFMDNADIEDSMRIDAHCYRKFHTFEGQDRKGRSGKERGQTLIHVEIEPAVGMEDEFEQWYQKQHLVMLSMIALTVGTEWSKRILAEVHTYKRAVYELIQSQGDASLNL